MMSYMPHGMCLLWRPGMLIAHVLSDALIALSYFLIPMLLFRMWMHRPAIKPAWLNTDLLLAFSVFTFACGASHIMQILVIWHPLYWLDAGIKWITALSSIVAVDMLWRVTPQTITGLDELARKYGVS